MIKILDWFATIPEEDKHIAFVGEHQSVTRKFLVTGDGWETYKDWGFHLDMAFDLSTVTSRAQRQLESTQVNTTENVSETVVKTNGTTMKEKYTVTEVDVDCSAKTDIATLKKQVVSNGIQLTWTVLRQHTQLPGKLRTTLRALGPDGQVKKSDLMVFEVDQAVVAEAAADIPQSEFEAMEEHMDEMLDSVLKNAQMVEMQLENLQDAVDRAETIKDTVATSLTRIQNIQTQTAKAQESAEQAAKDARDEADRVVIEWPCADEGFDLEMGVNRLDMTHVTHNRGQLANGLLGNDSSKKLSLTGYIPVKEGDVLSYQRTDPDTGTRIYGNLYAVCLFDQYKEVNFEANQYKAGEDGTLHEITIPPGVSYVRLTLYRLETAVDPAVVLARDLIPYERFWAVRKLKAEGYDAAHMEAALQPVRCVPQTLTEAQKAQARANIGVPVDEQWMTQQTKRLDMVEQTGQDCVRELESLRMDSAGTAHETARDAWLASLADSEYDLHQQIDALDSKVTTVSDKAQSLNVGLSQLYTRVETIQKNLGNIDSALDGILELQQAWIGGGSQ